MAATITSFFSIIIWAWRCTRRGTKMRDRCRIKGRVPAASVPSAWPSPFCTLTPWVFNDAFSLSHFLSRPSSVSLHSPTHPYTLSALTLAPDLSMMDHLTGHCLLCVHVNLRSTKLVPLFLNWETSVPHITSLVAYQTPFCSRICSVPTELKLTSRDRSTSNTFSQKISFFGKGKKRKRIFLPTLFSSVFRWESLRK